MKFSEVQLVCEHCGKDALVNPEKINILFFKSKDESTTIQKIYISCKGICDDIISKENSQYYPGWQDLGDFTNPALYLKRTMAIINNCKNKGADWISDEAFSVLKDILLIMAEYVFRELSEDEIEKFESLSAIESY